MANDDVIFSNYTKKKQQFCYDNTRLWLQILHGKINKKRNDLTSLETLIWACVIELSALYSIGDYFVELLSINNTG